MACRKTHREAYRLACRRRQRIAHDVTGCKKTAARYATRKHVASALRYAHTHAIVSVMILLSPVPSAFRRIADGKTSMNTQLPPICCLCGSAHHDCQRNLISIGRMWYATRVSACEHVAKREEHKQETTMITARQLVRYIVARCDADGTPVNETQLQRMLYVLQVTFVRASGGRLLFPDEFDACPCGPIITSVHAEYVHEGSRPIYVHDAITPDDIGLDSHTAAFVDDGIMTLCSMYPRDLVRITQGNGSPWSVVYEHDGMRRIGNDVLIRTVLRDQA